MRRFWKEWGRTVIIGVLILAVALGLRLYNLTILPIFADEAIYIRWAQVMNSEPTLRFLPLSDGKQPLFHWILMFLVRRFSDPLFIGRLVSVTTGLGTVLGIGATTYLLFKNKTSALLASLLWAISPFALFFDRMALVDSMLTMFGVWTLFLGVATAKSKRFDLAMLTGFAFGFALLTKSSALFFALLLPTTWIFSTWPRKNSQKANNLIRLSFLLAITFTIGFGMYNIQRLGPNFHLLSSRTQDYIYPLSHIWQDPLDPFISYFHRSFQFLWIMGPASVLALAVLGITGNLKKNWKQLLFLVSWALIPIVAQAEFAKVITARYILFAVPPFLILGSSALLTNKKNLQKIVLVIIGIFVIQSLMYNRLLLTNPETANLPRGERSGYLEEWTAGTGIREAAEFIKNESAQNPEAQIVVGTEGFFGTLPDGLQIYLEGEPNVLVIGIGLGLVEVPSSLVESAEAGNITYLLANSSRLKFDKEFTDLGLIEVASWQKAERPSGLRE